MFTQSTFRSLLSPRLALNAMVLLYQQQTSDEKSHTVSHHNGKGFALQTLDGAKVAEWFLGNSQGSPGPLVYRRLIEIACYHWKQLIGLGLFCPTFTPTAKVVKVSPPMMVLELLATDPFQHRLPTDQIRAMEVRRLLAISP